MKNVDESGKFATNRGRAPHKGGYHAGKNKGINPFKVWFEKTINGVTVKVSSLKRHKIQPCD